MTSSNSVSSLIQFLDEDLFAIKLSPPKTEIHRLILDNEMDVLLIHNSAFKNSEAMLTVDAGSIYDPVGITGLAQLVEHLIFSESYKLDSSVDYSKEFINYQNKNSGMANSVTDSEKITFYLRNNDSKFRKALKLFSNVIANPVFTNSLCSSEIENIENKLQEYDSDPKNKILKLIEFFSDDRIPESRFIIGNKNPLRINNIAEEAKEFYSNYFKANRMKLVIKSKVPIEEMKEFAKFFEVFPKEIQSSNLFHIQKKMKQNKNPSTSFLDHSAVMKFKEEYRGKIIKYRDQNPRPFVYFYFRFPSSFKGLTSIHLDYLEESISQHLKPVFFDNSFFKKIKAVHHDYRRKKEFFITAEFVEESYEKTNLFVSFMYEYFKSLKPDRAFFEDVKNKTIAKYEKNTDHSNILQTYSDNLFLNSTSKLGEFEKSVEFDEKVFEDLFEIFADIDNWIVFASTLDSNLPRSIPNYPCVFSDPIPIVFETSLNGFFINLSKTKYAKITDVKVNNVLTNLNVIKKTSVIKHVELRNGEYTFLREYPVFGEYCEVALNFISSVKKFKNFSNELYNHALLKRIQKICREYNVECEIKIICSSLFDNNLLVRLKNVDLTRFFKMLKEQLKNYKFNTSEIDDAKRTVMQNFIKVQESGLCDLLKFCFPYIIKKVDLNFEIDDYYPIQFNEDYYLMITAAGRINENDILTIFENFGSTGSREIFDDLKLNGENFCIYNPDHTDKSFIIAYHLTAESKIKEFAMANLLKKIFSFSLNQLIIEKFGLFFKLEVDYTYIRQKVFLTFGIKTLSDSSLIKDELIKAIKSYSEIIEKISEENLDKFKKSAFNIFKWKMHEKKKLTSFALLSTLTGIYNENFQALIIESLYSINLEELKSLQDLFSAQPFVLTGTNKAQNIS